MKDELQEVFKLAARYFLKKYREKGGTQGRLAEKLGVTQSYVSSVITGSKSASLVLQGQIAHILSGKKYEEFLAIGRRIKNGLDPELHIKKEAEDSVESLIARLTHYVVDHQRIEGELVARKNFYETVVENLQSGVMVNDQQDTIHYVNSYMAKIIGRPVDDIIGTNTLIKSEKFPERQIDKFVSFYTKAKETLEPVFYEDIQVVSSGGMEIVITGWIIPILKNNQFDGMIITVRDMTRLQRMNQSMLATLEYADCPVALALQEYEGGPVSSFHMNKECQKLMGIDQYGLSVDKDSIKKAMLVSASLMENGEEWLVFTSKNFKGRDFAEMEIRMKDGRKFSWESKALRDQENLYHGRIVHIKEIKRNRRRGDKMKLVKGGRKKVKG
jgi:PAS domain S-box-containing protein